MIIVQSFLYVYSTAYHTVWSTGSLLPPWYFALTCLCDNRKDYEKGYKKFLGLVKKQEQLLRGTCKASILNLYQTSKQRVCINRSISCKTSKNILKSSLVCRLHVSNNAECLGYSAYEISLLHGCFLLATEDYLYQLKATKSQNIVLM